MAIKLRRVMILSNDEINQREEFEYILVAPINTVKEKEKTKNWYKKLKEDEHPIFVYLPNDSFERYVDLSQTTTIHKSLLLHKLTKIPDERMEVIEESLLECFSLGIFHDYPQDNINEMEEANK